MKNAKDNCSDSECTHADVMLYGFATGQPPSGVYGWPGCSYPLPLPERSGYAYASEWIWKTVPFILLIMGTLGNLLTGIVIVRNFRRLSSTAVYLLALAITDTVFLFNPPLRNWVRRVTGFRMRHISNWFCKISMFLTFASFHFSAWILVAVTIERVVSVMLPYHVKRSCTQRNAVIITFILILAICVMNSHLLYGFGHSALPAYEGFDEGCSPMYEKYDRFYNYQWFWMHFALGYAVPFLVILIGNALVIRGIRRRQRWLDEQTFAEHKQRRRYHSDRSRTLMIILILLNTVFFVSQTPIAVFLLYFTYVIDDMNSYACTDFPRYMLAAEKMYFWEAVGHNFAYLNASMNFIMYVISGSRFRNEIVSLLLCKGRARTRTFTSTSGDGSGRRQIDTNIDSVSSD